jgi:hypothetical protein
VGELTDAEALMRALNRQLQLGLAWDDYCVPMNRPRGTRTPHWMGMVTILPNPTYL